MKGVAFTLSTCYYYKICGKYNLTFPLADESATDF